MRNNILILLACVLAVGLTGCGKSHDSVRSKMLSKIKDMTGILKGLTDEASAKNGAEKIKQIAVDMKQLAAEDKALGTATKEEDEKFRKDHEGEWTQAMSELTTEGQRLSTKDPKASMIVEPAMMEAMAPLMEVALSTVKK